MARASKPAVCVDELVTKALVALATADGPRRLVKSKAGKNPPLFETGSGANKEAAARLTDPERPLVAVHGKGNTEALQLSEAGFMAVLSHLPLDRVGMIAKDLCGAIDLSRRMAYLNEVIRVVPSAAIELAPIVEQTVAAERVEAEARAAAAAAERAREEAARAAITRYLALLEQRKRDRVESLQKELLAEGAEPLPSIAPPPAAPPIRPTSTEPATKEDAHFRRELAGRLVSTWLESYRLNKAEGRLFLETAMGNIPGLRQIGEEGQNSTFDARLHDSDPGVPGGTPVRILRPGWILEEGEGEYRLAPAKVAP